MREIKFRAWDKKELDMIYGVLPLSDGTFLIENSNSNKFVDVYCDDNIPPNNYVIQQYTGLKDKNGKEIYEGDIIEYEDVCVDGGGDGEIHQLFIEDLRTAFFFGISNKFVESKNIEVIGNIYENPNLIN
jgi:uncharacterized phage protein (TIGR01671 family)